MFLMLDARDFGLWELVAVFGAIGIVVAFATVRWAFGDDSKQEGHDDLRD